MNRIEEIYNKFLTGDNLTDEELTLGLEHFQQMADLLLACGPRFVLPCIEAYRVARDMQMFIQNRLEVEMEKMVKERYPFNIRRYPVYTTVGP